MSEIEPQAIYRKVWTVSHVLPEGDRVAFFDEGKSELVVVNALGGAVWDLLDGERSVSSIVNVLSDEVADAPEPDAILEAVVTFLEDLKQRAAIEEVLRSNPSEE